MNLIIVESPTKARTLSRFLGKDYAVEATMGHIKDLPKSKISVDIENGFEPNYELVDARKKQIGAIRKSAKGADKIYLATDPDREGEAISQHVKEILEDPKFKIHIPNLKRIVFHEITKHAVEEAIANPRDVDTSLVDAQIARRVLDRLVGYKLSPLLWKKVRRGLSAGRVQSVVVRLIVEREREIEAFKPQEYWEIYAKLSKHQSSGKTEDEFVAKLTKINDKNIEISDGKLAGDIYSKLKNSNWNIEDITQKTRSVSPHPPFSTSTLTQSAANLYGWSSKKTMSVAQKLYEEGLITYHRTDSFHISREAVDSLRNYINTNYGDKYLSKNPRHFKTKSKSAQEAHEAIRPTGLDAKFDSSAELGVRIQDSRFAKDGQKLYGLIWRRFVATQMSEAVYDQTKVSVLAKSPSVDSKFIFEANGVVLRFDGWKKLFDRKGDETLLPSGLARGDSMDLKNLTKDQKFTTPPARYNEASIIKTLEKLGIGRPSTYAPTISTIESRHYVEKVDRRFHPTKVGIAVNDFLIGNFDDIFDYSFTAGMEGNLDEIAEGKKNWQSMMGEFYKPFEKKLSEVEKKAERVQIATESLDKPCPTCPTEGRTGKKQGELVIRTGRFGKFISCSLFPECKHTEKYIDKIDMKCPKCPEEGRVGDDQGEVIVKRTRRGRTFYGCSRYPDCEFASWTDPSKSSKKN